MRYIAIAIPLIAPTCPSRSGAKAKVRIGLWASAYIGSTPHTLRVRQARPAGLSSSLARYGLSACSHIATAGDGTATVRLTSAWNRGPLQAHPSLGKTPACDTAQAHR